ncbi:DMT family transporter [Paraglaciecola aquimarina]|uniref:DMT family transporter n=1 Tax=Paraglaciecola aquimarina TaxID=1235557 RepID=A0ABU3SUW5_9ALTE|nr:DMT family transporter [Paraglaciecola aquimarina]MDU0353786.1 DMT family transporter [Paraglaciecola aquimarina]
MQIKHFLELLILSAVWGASFLFMRTTTGEFGPIMLVTLRSGIAALALLPFFIYKKLLPEFTSQWRAILFVGLTNTAIPFCLFSYSTFHLGAGYASILNATAPMFGALVGFFWLKDNLPRIAIFGLGLGFTGVLLLSLSKTSEDVGNVFLPTIAALSATFLYGLAACYSKKYLQGISSLTIAAGSQYFAVLALLPVSFFFWPETNPSTESWLQVVALALFCTAFAYILYFRLIANVGAERAITVAYLVPVFGVMWGVIFLQEKVTISMSVGASLVLFGVALTTGVIKLTKPNKGLV